MTDTAPDFFVALTDRRLVHFNGDDAAVFLQNIMTNDIAGAASGLVYTCLLTPQGQFLHDFFVTRWDDGFLVDIDADRADDFLQRLGVFKLRAKVAMTVQNGIQVYAGRTGMADPRRTGLGGRVYTADVLPTSGTPDDYHDFLTLRGVPQSQAVYPMKDVVADVNLDTLNAIAWDKGCFIGQEVTARMRYKALAKKRLFAVTGTGLKPQTAVLQDGKPVGDIRQTRRDFTGGLAVLRIAAVERQAETPLSCETTGTPVVATSLIDA